MTTPALIIDMHTHLFNANYLPLQEIFISRGIPKRYARKLQKIILILARESNLRFNLPPEGSFESLLKSNIAAIPTDEHEPLSQALIDTLEDLIIQQLYQKVYSSDNQFETISAVEDSDLYELLVEINNEFGDKDSTATLNLHLDTGFIEVSKNAEPFAGVYQKGIFSGLRRMLYRYLKKAMRFVENAGDFLDFVLTILRGEKKLLSRLEDYYENTGAQFLLSHYMMDMAHPFDGSAKFEFYEKQLKKMSSLEKYSKGTLIGFSAFDPYRCLNQNMSDEEIITLINTSMSYGKVGFKFYPPLGYKAADNDEPAMERVIDVFFNYCAAKKIPVFTHCTPSGFEQSPGTGTNSHPKYWEKCLSKPGREDLILCFGHAGGGRRKIGNKIVYGWLSGINDDDRWNDEDNYAREVVRLCKKYKNVYCEIAYMHEIIDNHSEDSYTKFKERLEIVMTSSTDSDHPYPFSEKIMYGSDWHMPSMVNDIDKYIDSVISIFSDSNSALAPYRKEFFASNAIRYLSLSTHLDRISDIMGTDYVAAIQAKISLV